MQIWLRSNAGVTPIKRLTLFWCVVTAWKWILTFPFCMWRCGVRREMRHPFQKHKCTNEVIWAFIHFSSYDTELSPPFHSCFQLSSLWVAVLSIAYHKSQAANTITHAHWQIIESIFYQLIINKGIRNWPGWLSPVWLFHLDFPWPNKQCVSVCLCVCCVLVCPSVHNVVYVCVCVRHWALGLAWQPCVPTSHCLFVLSPLEIWAGGYDTCVCIRVKMIDRKSVV